MSGRRRPTSTSAFGVGRRESHDASAFYSRFKAPALCDDDAVTPSPIDGKIIAGDARHMSEVEDASVALVVTSPPYFAGKEYEAALGEGHVPASYLEYLAMLTDVFAECVRTLEPGGRIAVNVANLGRKPYRSLSADVIGILQDELGLLMRGEVIWLKARGASGSCAWGSFQSPANPVLRDLTERVVIASKGRFDRAMTRRTREGRGLPSEISITKDEFIEATTDVWEIPSESATRVGHPAPFPVELPVRLIELYTYRQDLVLDPFMGSGTTAVAAVQTGRRYVGYDTESDYVRIAQQRAAQETDRVIEDGHDDARRPGGSSARIVASGARGPAPDAGDAAHPPPGHATAAREFARELLSACGFTDIVDNRRLTAAAEITLSGVDQTGGRWFFDVSGAFTTTRAGLRRADTLWKALGRAAVLHAAQPDVPLVLLTTSAPPAGSAGDRAWRSLGATATAGDVGTVYDVVDMTSRDDQERLCRYGLAGRPAHGVARPSGP